MSGVQVIIEDLSDHPWCVHGPTLLFSRLIDGKAREFYACSACRDRKDCTFFLWKDERKRTAHTQNVTTLVDSADVNSLNLIYKEICGAPQRHRSYCHTCTKLYNAKNDSDHLEHDVTNDLSDRLLRHPSELLKPLENAKKEAQYLFSSNSVRVIVDIMRENDLKNVLCIGAPRIHEFVRSSFSDMSSILLDMDQRHQNFYSASEFLPYNLFNNFFFTPDENLSLLTFIKKHCNKGIALITDPPFGGRVEPLADSIKKFDELCKANGLKRDLPVFFIFPYFMERQILNSLPNYTMLDYKVDYDNHALFKEGPKARKFGSLVRIFTNVPQSKVTLPPDQGYKYCDPCSRWVYQNNVHCDKCACCPSKDGRTYVHCDICKRCVKPSWKHCQICGKCCLDVHNCAQIEFVQKCFHCNEPGHKKRDCPTAQNGVKRKKNHKKFSKSKKIKC